MPACCSRSREGAWIEISLRLELSTTTARRSREGAWIEILGLDVDEENAEVAPARERGLKLVLLIVLPPLLRRSREGAWIEIVTTLFCTGLVLSLPRGSVD